MDERSGGLVGKCVTGNNIKWIGVGLDRVGVAATKPSAQHTHARNQPINQKHQATKNTAVCCCCCFGGGARIFHSVGLLSQSGCVLVSASQFCQKGHEQEPGSSAQQRTEENARFR